MLTDASTSDIAGLQAEVLERNGTPKSANGWRGSSRSTNMYYGFGGSRGSALAPFINPTTEDGGLFMDKLFQLSRGSEPLQIQARRYREDASRPAFHWRGSMALNYQARGITDIA